VTAKTYVLVWPIVEPVGDITTTTNHKTL